MRPIPASASHLRNAKFQRPRLGIRAIERPRLEALLDAATLRLVVISAPAGFGKTTLASTWTARLESPVAWFTIDGGDDDPTAVARGMAIALQRAGYAIGDDLAVLSDRPGVAPVELGRALAYEIERLRRPVVLVLDDVHAVPPAAVQDLLAGLTEHHPDDLLLVLVGRTPPPLPVARFVAAGRARVLDASLVAFDEAEVGALLRQGAPDAVLDPGALRETTGGWPAAVSLAVMALASGSSPVDPDAVDQPLAALVEETVSTFPRDQQDLLMRLATVDVVSADLVEAMAGQQEGSPRYGHLLEGLVTTNMLVQGVGESGVTYRFHPLFRDYLVRRLREEGGDEAFRAAALAASGWLEDRGEIDAALSALLASGQEEEAADLVERHADAARNSDRWRDLERWLRRLDERIVNRRPALVVATSAVLLMRGMFPAMRLVDQEARRLLDSLDPDDPALGPLRSDLDTHAYVADFAMHLVPQPGAPGNRGALDRLTAPAPAPNPVVQMTRERVPAILACAPPDHYFTQSHLLNHQIMAMVADGDYERALALVQDIHQRNIMVPNPMTARAFLGAAIAHLQVGMFGRVIEAANQVFRLSVALDLPIAAHWACSFKSVAALHLGDYDLAIEAAEAAEPFREHANWNADRLARTVRTIAQHQLGLVDQLADEQVQPRTGSFVYANPGFLALADSLAARLALLDGDRAAVEAWLRDTTFVPMANSLLLPDLPAAIRPRALIFIGGDANLAEAETLLEAIAEVANGIRSRGGRIELLTLLSMLRTAQGRPAEGTRALRDALLLADPVGDLWPFLEGRTQLETGIASIARNEPGWQFPADVLRAFARAPGGPASVGERRAAAAFAAGLTTREAEVLAALASTRTIPEIAGHLFLSRNTVKGHTIHIYQKLGVASRRDAVLRAIELGIL